MHTPHPFFVAILLTFSTFSAQAQFSIGLRGGLLQSSFERSNFQNAGTTFENRTGLVGGLITEFRINEGFAIQPEIDWIQKGEKSTTIISIPLISTIQTDVTERLNYVEIPILLKAGFKAGPVRFDALAGPSFAYAISGKRTAQTTTTITLSNQTTVGDKITEEYDFEQDFNKPDVGLQGGLCLSAGLGSSRIFVDGRYLYGLSNLNAQDNSEIEISNRGVAISAGILLGF